MAEKDLGWVAIQMQVLDSNMNKFIHPRPAQEKSLNHEAILAVRPVSVADQPFHFRFVKTVYRSPASPWRLQFETPACLLHHVLGLVIRQMVLPPKLGR